MGEDSIYEKICELVDERIKDEQELLHLKNLIGQNPDAKLEYEIQNKVKVMLQTRCCKEKSPSQLCTKVLSQIRKQTDN